MSSFESTPPLSLQSGSRFQYDSTLSSETIKLPLDATDDARKLVRILQCTQCSLPLRHPTILPCGNSVCKTCLPECHPRLNVSYPASTPERSLGFACPFSNCKQEHALADCGVDVVLTKLMEIIKSDIASFREQVDVAPILLEEKDRWAVDGVSSLGQHATRSTVHTGGRLVATYSMAENGDLAYDSELLYTNVDIDNEHSQDLDAAVLDHLEQATRAELDCQVCYGLFLDPLTTPCGHTFCRKCLRRVFDHTNACPICRRSLRISPEIIEKEYPSNKRIANLLVNLCSDALAIRIEQVLEDEKHASAELDTPLFVCGVAFPYMPTFLHIFEPRYRLMIRRALQADGCFGMLLHNPRQIPQGELGRVRFCEYGTLMKITNFQQFPDGRSLIETVGVSRFRVLKHGILDDYHVGKVERIDDVSLAEEESLEASETAMPASTPNNTIGTPQTNTQTGRPSSQNIDSLSTQQLLDFCTSYVGRMKGISTSWLQGAFINNHGECPTDPVLFPWWFASILPIVEAEKYRLMDTKTVRSRLKICAGWILRIEAEKWSRSASCNAI